MDTLTKENTDASCKAHQANPRTQPLSDSSCFPKNASKPAKQKKNKRRKEKRIE